MSFTDNVLHFQFEFCLFDRENVNNADETYKYVLSVDIILWIAKKEKTTKTPKWTILTIFKNCHPIQ